ncbi:MAG: hypothetical protein KDA90_22130, partial [Planctomycetaceae bacterium]|nr:hypothetical protein [Planctomycetaceae bacterium]
VAAQSGDRNRIIEPFPFRVDLDGNGIANEMGVFTAYLDTASAYNKDPVYELDGDVDRDGIPDSILLDLGLDIITLPDNRQVVPMAMMKWVDAGGLLNINAHGNTAGLASIADNGGGPGYLLKNNLWTGYPLSASNQGLSSFEVNLALGLTAELPTDMNDPDYVHPSLLSQHRAYLGAYPSNRYQLGELEALMLFCGRMQYASDSTTLLTSTPLLGRYGDSGAVSFLQNWSRAGNMTMDPTTAAAPTRMPGAGAEGSNDDYDSNGFPVRGTNTVWVSNPIDYYGTGDPTQPGGGNYRVRLKNNGIPSYGINWGPSDLPAAPYQDPATRNVDFRDDADETIVEKDLRTSNDSLFDISEMFFLHGSSGDQRTMRLASRLQELASINFRDSPSAPTIRRRFTIDSYDRLEFGLSPRRPGANRDWEFNDWQSIWPTNGEPFDRAFPPRFGTTTVFSSTDPYRAELRQILAQRADTDPSVLMPFDETRTNPSRPRTLVQRRLDINRYLAGLTSTGQPNFRRPQVHPAPLASAVPAAADELTARRERQRMARDIYVLLYTLGGGNDSINYATTSNADPGMGDRPLYTDTQLERMAQFAVNMVDSTDEDVVITRFEYDKDLSDGWNYDDDPFTADGVAGDRGVVEGVELPQLTINESLFVFNKEAMNNSGDTEWNDAEDRSFAYIELKNPTPYSVDLSVDGWQVRLEIESPKGTVATASSRDLHFKSGSIAPQGIFTLGSTLGASGNAGVSDSIMRMKSDKSQTAFDKFIPASQTLNLDLIATASGGSTYQLVNVGGTTPNSTQGDFFNATTASMLEQFGGVIRVSLRRRMNQYRTFPASFDAADAENQDNPWIEVDRSEIEIPVGTSGNGFAIFNADNVDMSDSDSSKHFLADYKNLNSRHRAETLDRSTEVATTPTAGAKGDDTLGTDNSSTSLWLPVWDRDFTSVVELLSLPLYGPGDVTKYLREWAGTGDDPRFALSMILNPRKPTNAADPMTADPDLDNRWYRVLEFLTVTPQSLERQANPNDTSGGIVGVMTYPRRVAGKINLNMLRHEAVLSGLLDDQTLDRYNVDRPTQQLGPVDSDRNWFDEMRRSRDGYDPLLAYNGVALNIPGSVDSHPFKPLSNASVSKDFSLDDTIFRKNDSTSSFQSLGLFESRPESHASSNNNEIDPHTRNRLLAKVYNNSTTRSTMFAGWIEIQFHEAHQLSSGAVQVGAEATDIRHRRLFVVVDLSRLEEAYDSSTETFDFQDFVVYQRELP